MINRFQRNLLAIAIATFVPSALVGQETLKDTYKVYVNQPSAGFIDTLNRLDSDDKFILSTDEWFPIGDADIWVIFLQSEQEIQYQPNLVQTVWEEVGNDINDVVLLKLNLRDSQPINLIFIDLVGKTEVAPNFLGCVAAATMINQRFPHLFSTPQLLEANCRHYQR